MRTTNRNALNRFTRQAAVNFLRDFQRGRRLSFLFSLWARATITGGCGMRTVLRASAALGGEVFDPLWEALTPERNMLPAGRLLPSYRVRCDATRVVQSLLFRLWRDISRRPDTVPRLPARRLLQHWLRLVPTRPARHFALTVRLGGARRRDVARLAICFRQWIEASSIPPADIIDWRLTTEGNRLRAQGTRRRVRPEWVRLHHERCEARLQLQERQAPQW